MTSIKPTISTTEHPVQLALNIIESKDMNYVSMLENATHTSPRLINPFDVAAAREWVEQVALKQDRCPPASIRKRNLPDMDINTISVTYGSDEEFSVRVYNPTPPNGHGPDKNDSHRAALIMFHGGGWTHGCPKIDEDLAIFFSSELRAVVVNVDYRLAPEHRFPIPRDDCWQAIQWVTDHAEEYNIDVLRIALWGYSAGGNLAASIALRDATEHVKSRLCHLSIVVPPTCHPNAYPAEITGVESSLNKFDTAPIPAKHIVEKTLDAYAGDLATTSGVSILDAAIPGNHPPVSVTVAGRDILRDEGIAYALRVRNAGIDSQLHIVPGVPHDMMFPPTTHVARQFFRDQARVLDYALNYN